MTREAPTGPSLAPDRKPRPAAPGGRGADHVTHIIAGEFAVVTEAGRVLATTLGSCVAACLHDPVRRIGGMNHFLLPEAPGDKLSASARYGSVSMERLVNGLLSRGAQRRDLVAKVFGGASFGEWASGIGLRNVEFVMAYLADEGIATLAWDVGGNNARAVRFIPTTGEGFVRTIGMATALEVARREREHQRRLREQPVEGEVELF